MKIQLDVLERALVRALAHARELGAESVEVQDDLYWFVPSPALTDAERIPSDLTLGSLADDWDNLVRVARGERDAIGYDLVWAASVLRILGDRTP